MEEVILYGGLPVRRGDVYNDVLKRTGSHKAAEQFAFGFATKLAPPGVAASLGRGTREAPLTAN
jgi:hypothetical protein